MMCELGGDADRLVVPLYGILDVANTEVRKIALVVLASSTDEVEVEIAALALATHDDEPPLASVAPHSALEVVVVDAVTGSASPSHGTHVLHAVEELLADQRLVPALVLDAVIGDVTEVVPIAEHLADFGDRDRIAGRMLLRRFDAETGISECFQELGEAVSPSRV
jgi:hypothetical protein